MLFQLPRWVWLGGFVLAWVAGLVNVVGYLSFEHQAVTHLTGTTTLLGAALAQGQWGASGHLLAVIASFVGGALLSGLIIGDGALRLGRRYGMVLGLETIALVLAVPLLEHELIWGSYLAGLACGLQNGMGTTYSGAVVRTTHVTGMLTDLGLALGQWLRGRAVEPRRLTLCLVVVSGFLLGALCGAHLFAALHYAALYVSAATTFALALVYWLYRWRTHAGGLAGKDHADR
ncbi:YoaK family protein [Chitinolyticbacter albus]|uniref:YoaK family protein n=1 Tax=Chitinolyticbacter albus TaxID=2961951 RepID=UPI00210CAA3C|nr:YoaK family protein [Chitinolyticbacter albus]